MNTTSATAFVRKDCVLCEETGGGYPGNWTGRFIWDAGEAVPYQYKLMIRKTVMFESTVPAARLRITAADRYILYVNGTYAGRGPARGTGPEWKSYDHYDLTDRLQPGVNVIAVMAHYFGTINAFSFNQRSGFWAELEWCGHDGIEHVLGTDESWKVLPAGAYNCRDVAVRNKHVGVPNEMFDARRDVTDWQMPSFDDSVWPQARVLPLESVCFWRYLEPRKVPMLREREVRPIRVEKRCQVRELPPSVFSGPQIAERMALEPMMELKEARAEHLECLLEDQPDGGAIFQSVPRARTLGSYHPCVILDFGRPYMGVPRIEFEAEEGAVIEIAHGCALQPDGRVDAFQLMAKGGASRFADRCIARKGPQVWQLYETSLIRYLQIVIRNQSPSPDHCGWPPPLTGAVQAGIPGPLAPLRMLSVSVIAQEYPVDQTGQFACSDENLGRIWQAGVNNAYLHMQEDLQFDAERERLTYCMIGEVEQIHHAIRSGFGGAAAEFTEENFRQTVRMQQPGGLLSAYLRSPSSLKVPSLSGNPNHRMPIMPTSNMTYSHHGMFFPQAVLNYYRYTGNIEFLRENVPAVMRLASCFSNFEQQETGLVRNLPGIVWLDWTNRDLRDISFSINAMYRKMLLDVTTIAGLTGLRDVETANRAKAERVKDSLRRLHWVAGKGLFCDAVIAGKQSHIFTELANGLALLYGIADAEQAEAIVKRLTDPDKCLDRSCRVSPLYFHYVMEGLIKAGAAAYAWRYLADRFRHITYGDAFPTVGECWPDNPPEWNVGEMSRIHAGSGGVVWTLSSHALGVYPLEPGYRRVRIDPQHGDLRHAEGVFPTVAGNISVRWRRDACRYTLSVELPDTMEAEIVVADAAETNGMIEHNGRRWEAGAASENAACRIADGKILVFVSGGQHKITFDPRR